MINAFVLVRDEEYTLATTRYMSRNAVERTVKELKELDIDEIYVVSKREILLPGVTWIDNISKVCKDLVEVPGRCLLVSPFYLFVDSGDYQKLLNVKRAAALGTSDEVLEVIALPNKYLYNYEKLKFIYFGVDKPYRLNDLKEYEKLTNDLKYHHNQKLIKKGVKFIDVNNTYISEDASVGEGSVIYPGTIIEGYCLIGKNCLIESNSYICSSVIKDNSKVSSSRIINSYIEENNVIGYASEIIESAMGKDCNIGAHSHFENVHLANNCNVLFNDYLVDTNALENVNIGVGVTTLKGGIEIGRDCVIGNGVNILGPLKIGDKCVVEAGSTIDMDVPEGHTALARLYQVNRKI